MATKKTIAIIGAEVRMDAAITKHLSKGNYRLLLFGHEKEGVQQFLKEIKMENQSVEAECTGCPYDASWEADLIILNEFDREEITTKIKPVATQKPVIDLSGKASDEQLKKLLPDSNIIQIKDGSTDEIIKIIQTL